MYLEREDGAFGKAKSHTSKPRFLSSAVSSSLGGPSTWIHHSILWVFEANSALFGFPARCLAEKPEREDGTVVASVNSRFRFLCSNTLANTFYTAAMRSDTTRTIWFEENDVIVRGNLETLRRF